MATHGVWTGQGASLYDTGSSDVNDNWWLDGAYTAPAGLGLWNAAISTVNTDNFWSGTVTTWGPSSIGNGIHVGAFCGFAINMQRVGSLDIDGNSSVGYGTRFAVTGGGPYQQLAVNGTLSLNATKSTIQPDVVGKGNVVVTGAGGHVEFQNTIGSGETIWCLEGLTQIDQPQLLHGALFGPDMPGPSNGTLLLNNGLDLSGASPLNTFLVNDDLMFFNNKNLVLDVKYHPMHGYVSVMEQPQGALLYWNRDHPHTGNFASFDVYPTAAAHPTA